MKNYLILFLLLFISYFSIAQQSTDTTSIIFPLEGKPIKNCRIIAIDSVNIISYLQESDTLLVVARAYINNGELISLFNKPGAIQVLRIPAKMTIDTSLNFEENKDYFYHENLHHQYKNQSKIGIPFLGAGILFLTSGLGIYYSGNDVADYYFTDRKAPAILLMLIGGSSMAIGGMIIGVNSSKAIKQNKEMQKTKNNKISLNIGMQKNGVGISLRF